MVTFRVEVPDDDDTSNKDVLKKIYDGVEIPRYKTPGWEITAYNATYRPITDPIALARWKKQKEAIA